MFAYQKNTPSFLVVIGCALLLGGASRLLDAIPLAACVVTLAVLAYSFAERSAVDEPLWVGRLSLLSTGLLYLGLGHCLGLFVVPLLGVAAAVRRGAGGRPPL